MKWIGKRHLLLRLKWHYADWLTKKEQTAKTGEISDKLVSGHTYELLCAKDVSFVLDVSGGIMQKSQNVQ